ncbi:MAG: hypothetical protein KDE34_27405, partial [Anaerolineales bacterium]|nr:hypothetical protein [Anaerolineales bacterium]
MNRLRSLTPTSLVVLCFPLLLLLLFFGSVQSATQKSPATAPNGLQHLAQITGQPLQPSPISEDGCPAGGTVDQDGWVVNYVTTNHDGLRVYDVAYNGVTIMHSSKLVEWHSDYGTSGFRSETGCTGGGGGFSIFPYGDTQVRSIVDGPTTVGFEIVQDFRMGNWGANCNYRYEQHFQFFSDGRFRVVAGAYGRGCGSDAMYRPVIRLDLAIGGQENNQVASWDGNAWTDVATERWFLPSDLQHFNGLYPLRISGNGYSYYMEPAQGQFGDEGRGDTPFVYVTQYQAAEGENDLGVIGACCNDDHRQGPDQFVNGESVANENIVLWYVSQAQTDVTVGDMYCWTVTGEPNPETYPCFTGPMFVPINAPVTPTPTATTSPSATQTPSPTATPTPITVLLPAIQRAPPTPTPTATPPPASSGAIDITVIYYNPPGGTEPNE